MVGHECPHAQDATITFLVPPVPNPITFGERQGD